MRRLALALCLLLLATAPVEARRETSVRYPYSQVWTTAVRVMRVDFESPITEKDKDEGYFLFEFPHAGKVHPGSVEVIEQQDGARLVVKIPAMPSYVEQMVIDRMLRRLAKDHGAPLEPKEPAAEEPPPEKETPPSAPPKDDAAAAAKQ